MGQSIGTDVVRVHHGDCLTHLRSMPDESVHAIITDPPYGMSNHSPEIITKAIIAWASGDRERVPDPKSGFMNAAWDSFVPPPAVWDECLRVLKPGGHMAVFCATRTVGLMDMSIRLAGFEVRDSLAAWLYGSGFPKSLDVGKAIDKAGGGSPVEHGRVLRAARERSGLSRAAVAERVGCQPQSVGDWEDGRARTFGEAREVCVPSVEYREKLADLLGYTADERQVAGVGRKAGPLHGYGHGEVLYGPAATGAARAWSGWGTALKPGWEPVLIARKPQDTAGMLVEIGSHLDRLESECSSSAQPAGASSAPTPHASPAAKAGTAPGSAATPPADDPARPTATGAADDSSATTGTSSSESTARTCSNIVMSWRASWAECCSLMNTSTISTTSETTTDLRTLSSCLRALTAESMAVNLTLPDGSPSPVAAVDALFVVVVSSLRATLARSAIETATGATLTSPLDEVEQSEYRPQCEPIIVARKPLSGTVAATVLAHGTGAINIDATRVAHANEADRAESEAKNAHADFGSGARTNEVYGRDAKDRPQYDGSAGRWPVNVLLCHHPECSETDGCHPWCHVVALDEQSGTTKSSAHTRHNSQRASGMREGGDLGYAETGSPADSGGASRFFPQFRYQAKAGGKERPEAWGKPRKCRCAVSRPFDPETGTLPPRWRAGTVCAYCERESEFYGWPTVKPQGLMQWLVRLLCPPGGTVVDPFGGSGSTAQAVRDEGFRAVSIERDCHAYMLHAVRLDLPTEEIKCATTSHAADIDVAAMAGSSSTSRSGSGTTGDRSPLDTTSTTSTTTSSTTTPPTSSSSTRSRTSDSTPDVNSVTAPGGSRAESVASSSRSASRTGTSRAKGGRSTDAAARVTSARSSRGSEPVAAPPPSAPPDDTPAGRIAACGDVGALTVLHAELRAGGEIEGEQLWAMVQARWDELSAAARPSARKTRVSRPRKPSWAK